uniref:Sushi domain-containing protein n=1 Tax=Ursus maritimus TaxID=29073 RepID=A0A452V4H0_URSMA
MKGPNIIQCVDGEWTSLPICIEGTTCGDIPALDYGYVVESSAPPYHHGDSVEFNCRETFTLIGHRSITCAGGMWTQLPQCVGKCGPPPPIDNGDITSFPLPAYAPGSSVEYRCQAFYALQGNRNVICSNGQWSEPPKCLGKYFNVLMDSGKISVVNTMFCYL